MQTSRRPACYTTPVAFISPLGVVYMSDTDKTTGRGKIGEQIYAQVEALVGAEHITRTEAFQRIAVERGSRPGTVAANYYRIARLRNDGSVRPRGRKKAKTADADAVI